MCFLYCYRRQKEAEQKSIEDEANKRIEELVAKRVEEELERRREEIEAEVLRRVEEAKKVMEAQMLEEIERRKQEQLEEARKREVRAVSTILESGGRAGCKAFLEPYKHHHLSRRLRLLLHLHLPVRAGGAIGAVTQLYDNNSAKSIN